jgi:Phage integrase, N-terminal SAM-like domain
MGLEAGSWDAFIAACRHAGVGDTAVRWYVVRVERFLAAHPDCEPGRCEATGVQKYLEEAGRDTELPAWKLKQLVDALRLFFCHVVRAAWADGFDWQYWLESSRELESKHPTLGRHNHPIASSVLGEGVVGSAFKPAHHQSHHAAFIRNAPARERLRHQDGSGVARSCGRVDDDDLHARAESRREGCCQSD